MTTAVYRKLAQDAEKAFQWEHAAALWQKAIDEYPKCFADSKLARRDKENMRVRRDSCARMAG